MGICQKEHFVSLTHSASVIRLLHNQPRSGQEVLTEIDVIEVIIVFFDAIKYARVGHIFVFSA